MKTRFFVAALVLTIMQFGTDYCMNQYEKAPKSIDPLLFKNLNKLKPFLNRLLSKPQPKIIIPLDKPFTLSAVNIANKLWIDEQAGTAIINAIKSIQSGPLNEIITIKNYKKNWEITITKNKKSITVRKKVLKKEEEKENTGTPIDSGAQKIGTKIIPANNEPAQNVYQLLKITPQLRTMLGTYGLTGRHPYNLPCTLNNIQYGPISDNSIMCLPSPNLRKRYEREALIKKILDMIEAMGQSKTPIQSRKKEPQKPPLKKTTRATPTQSTPSSECTTSLSSCTSSCTSTLLSGDLIQNHLSTGKQSPKPATKDHYISVEEDPDQEWITLSSKDFGDFSGEPDISDGMRIEKKSMF